ncbi:hypothetical protein SDC9_109838 [bioreactor metagenome]|uniref:HEAT repeat domain-containing protein n=1 Tax=bioreactor metagenome TaxID=1076179 RepID=A0A645BBX4_9ZZZZ
MRAIVATALASFDVNQNMDPLIDLLCDRAWWVRYRAATSLILCSDIAAVVKKIEAREDRYALEMFQFALDKQALCNRKVVA